MKHLKKYTYLLLISTLCISCERLVIDKDPENTPVEIFEVFWSELDKKYSYFEMYDIDWDLAYTQNRPLINNNMAEHELWEVLTNTFCILNDGHTGLIGKNRRFYSNNCNHNGFKRNFSYSIITNNYLGSSGKKVGPFLYGKINSIGYIYYKSFEMEVGEGDIDFLIDYFNNTEGLIIDIRDNGGGDDDNANIIISRLLTSKTLVEEIYYKSGPGHSDFTPPQKLYVSPGGSSQYTKPIAVLTNRNVYSAASNFASRISVLQHVALVGDTTGGGAGRPKHFDLPNGWIVRFSSNYSLRPDGHDYQQGTPPDYNIEMKDEDTEQGIDSILEFAINWIKTQ